MSIFRILILTTFASSILFAKSKAPIVAKQNTQTAQSENVAGLISINSLSAKDFSKIEAQISELVSKQGLSNAQLQQLEGLRNTALALSKLNSDCETFSINSVKNSKCQELYFVQIPKFEKQLSLISGNIYSSFINYQKKIETRTEQMNACVDGVEIFLNKNISPSNLINIQVLKSGIEPGLTPDSAEFYYTVKITPQKKAFALLESNISNWIGLCEEIVKHPQRREFSAYFIGQLGKKLNQLGFSYTFTDGLLDIYPNKIFSLSYTLNHKNTDLFKLNLENIIHSDNFLSFSFTDSGLVYTDAFVDNTKDTVISEGNLFIPDNSKNLIATIKFDSLMPMDMWRPINNSIQIQQEELRKDQFCATPFIDKDGQIYNHIRQGNLCMMDRFYNKFNTSLTEIGAPTDLKTICPQTYRLLYSTELIELIKAKRFSSTINNIPLLDEMEKCSNCYKSYYSGYSNTSGPFSSEFYINGKQSYNRLCAKEIK